MNAAFVKREILQLAIIVLNDVHGDHHYHHNHASYTLFKVVAASQYYITLGPIYSNAEKNL